MCTTLDERVDNLVTSVIPARVELDSSGKQSFFEKRTKKRLSVRLPSAIARVYQVRTDKSFLLLFLEKEGLLPSRVSVSRLVGITDFEWRVIQPLLPNKPRGIQRVDDRRVLNGIFWMLRSRAPWRDLPERYGPRTTC